MRLLFFFIALIFGHAVYAQSLPFDFENNQDVFETWGGAVFTAVTDPENASNTVAELQNSGGSNVYEGMAISLSPNIDLTEEKLVTLRFYNYETGNQTVQLKFEQSNSAQPDVLVERTVTQMGWHELSFDFSQATIIGQPGTQNATGYYAKMVLFVNPGVSVSGTYLFDDISGGTSGPSGGGDTGSVGNGQGPFDTLVWSDEFDGSGSFNSENWFAETIPPNPGWWHNGEKQHYTDREDNVYVSDGTLKIKAQKEIYYYNGYRQDYTSARLNSKFNFTYGRLEVRAKLPYGDGTWPAIWMLGTNIGAGYYAGEPNSVGWPACGEIDVMESWGYNPNVVQSAVHTTFQHGSVDHGDLSLTDIYNTYHVYAAEWYDDRIEFFVDDVKIYEYNPAVKTADNWPFTSNQFILLNVAMGGSWFEIDPNFQSAIMEIDYVRVYQSAVLGGADSEFMPKILLYPNPATNVMYVQSDLKGSGALLEVYDVQGRLVFSKTNPNKIESLSINHWEKGLYIVRVSYDDYSTTATVLKK